VFATAGVHPHTASDFDQAAGAAIEELLADPLVVAVGETGLDYYRKLSPVDDQQRVFRSHIALSRETDKPLVVHVREAWDDAMAILDQEGATRVVLHCFSGDAAVAAEAVRRGYYLSFAGNITYPNAEGLRRVAAGLPEGRVLAETDSPFLSPQHVRGRPNSPTNVLSVIETLAEARGGIDRDDMAAQTTVAALEAIPSLL
jgi:TatD DNase family protein